MLSDNNEPTKQPTNELNNVIQNIEIPEPEKEIIKDSFLLTLKPILYIANVSENQLGDDNNPRTASEAQDVAGLPLNQTPAKTVNYVGEEYEHNIEFREKNIFSAVFRKRSSRRRTRGRLFRQPCQCRCACSNRLLRSLLPLLQEPSNEA